MVFLLFPQALPVPLAPLPPQNGKHGVVSVARGENEGRFLVSVESGERDVTLEV